MFSYLSAKSNTPLDVGSGMVTLRNTFSLADGDTDEWWCADCARTGRPGGQSREGTASAISTSVPSAPSSER
jgi:hypothetical protein